MIRKMVLLGVTLAVISALAGFGLAYTYGVTKERIAQQIWESQIKAARQALPNVSRNEDFQELTDLADMVRKKSPLVDKIFQGHADGETVGYALQMAPRGYGGPVTIMVGIGLDGSVANIAVVEHKETPGLGSGIEEASWRSQFAGKRAEDPLKVNKDIDALSGATISTKAVIKGVKEALVAYGVIRSARP